MGKGSSIEMKLSEDEEIWWHTTKQPTTKFWQRQVGGEWPGGMESSFLKMFKKKSLHYLSLKIWHKHDCSSAKETADILAWRPVLSLFPKKVVL